MTIHIDIYNPWLWSSVYVIFAVIAMNIFAIIHRRLRNDIDRDFFMFPAILGTIFWPFTIVVVILALIIFCSIKIIIQPMIKLLILPSKLIKD